MGRTTARSTPRFHNTVKVRHYLPLARIGNSLSQLHEKTLHFQDHNCSEQQTALLNWLHYLRIALVETTLSVWLA